MTERLASLAALLDVMVRLRDPQQGCPWDREQTFATIAPYTLEEAYEVADAIESGDPQRLRDELGDLLFQVVFHSRMAQERGWFDFSAVAAAIHDKLVRRHPHVFQAHESPAGAALASRKSEAQGPHQAGAMQDGAAQASQHASAVDSAAHAAHLSANWEDQKERERAEHARSRGEDATHTLADIPRALPALTRAAKLGKRAARVGFDWTEPEQVRAKLAEELQELDSALGRAEPSRTEIADELGDVLFTLVNFSRHLRIDPEEALRNANAKFERRFRRMEALAQERGRNLRELSAAEWDALWNKSKGSPDP